ncbi:Rrf2 family transcriptional regulator [Rhizobiaceae bacterium n13]|uniref:Rrf2 family transcriptional regulator n=1 Tax=Ferirhizobium litorale TaxID=2927786 RepID=A0AAE3QL56_9HYPH|nr:Rrf2 family transcriptional regulator [Fererhizobium litorale]MDI7864933.1 Rrf2 family transcriptional regulator [Fererhizobium litorale]MDI7925053.1 Rrf2 family transcriptional regulator [Fererhizobium litorale]
MADEHGDVETNGGHAVAERVGSGHRKGVSLFGVSVEYGLHTLLWLVANNPRRASSRDLAEMQGVPPAMVAKIMPKLEKAGIVNSSDGISGGYELAKPPADISVLDVVDAIEGDRKLFDCKEVRRGCVLFGGTPPPWSIDGVCRIHAVMLRAEKRMRSELGKTSLADLAQGGRPEDFESLVANWFRDRTAARETARVKGLKEGRRLPR